VSLELGLHPASGHLVSHAVRFGRTLRQDGVRVTPDQIAVFARALREINLTHKGSFQDTARTTLVTRREDLEKFEQSFQRFWRELGLDWIPPGVIGNTLLPPTPGKPQSPRQAEVRQRSSTNPPRPFNEPPQVLLDRAMTYSEQEVMRVKRFDQMNDAELEIAKRAMQRFQWRVGQRFTRRLRSSRNGERLDVRRTIRRALRHQGEFVRLEARERKTKPRPLVVLADVSGSMERYARMLLQFMHAVTQRSARGERRKVESFAFGTRLTRITRSLERRSVDAALTEVGHVVNDWSGGTRIGGSLHEFNRTWARRVLGRGAVVIVISDGWDQGEPTLLGHEMERLQKTCHRLIWLNPLIGTQGFRPETRGLMAALPFIDDFLPVHNLLSLEQLALFLESLPERRSVRRAGFKT
jgi:hypothetical protein